MTHRLFPLLLIGLTAVLSYVLDWPNELMNFSLSIILLASELFNFIKYQNQIKTANLIKLKSNDWLGGWVTIAFVVYWFSDEPMNVWNIAAIVGVIIYGILDSIQNFRAHYLINEEGIRDMYGKQLIEASDITTTEFNSEQIAIHTTKYTNDLIIQSSKLESPSWDELTSELSKLSDEANIR
ncbi:hypothetical protein [Ekhidna sp.]|uniref:hypothetical protein n=1 Tax=Ekhidna sp. TaxID=2608089 RepID=UPI003BAAA816